jgi:hypothetical protein
MKTLGRNQTSLHIRMLVLILKIISRKADHFANNPPAKGYALFHCRMRREKGGLPWRAKHSASLRTVLSTARRSYAHLPLGPVGRAWHRLPNGASLAKRPGKLQKYLSAPLPTYLRRGKSSRSVLVEEPRLLSNEPHPIHAPGQSRRTQIQGQPIRYSVGVLGSLAPRTLSPRRRVRPFDSPKRLEKLFTKLAYGDYWKPMRGVSSIAHSSPCLHRENI